MENQLDIKKLSVTELKALKSDLYEALAQNQQNIQIINQEIASRSKEQPDGKPISKN